jgi:hypothetical protein
VSNLDCFLDGLHANCYFSNSWDWECPRDRTGSHDHVIIFVPRKRMVREVEKLFQVSAPFLF